jgi:hopanoid-associated phosphorylase
MASSRPALLVITGLQREAQIATGDGVVTLCSGGNPELLRERLSALFSARPREGGDPEQKDWIPAYAGMSGGEVRAILSFGLAGGLAPHLQSGDLVIASHIVAGGTRHEADPDWHEAIASILGAAMPVHRGTIAGHDAVLTKAADKAQLHALTAALAVDMESHIAADYAQRHGIPFAAIRAISDPAGRSLPDIAHNALRPDGSVDLTKVISGVVRRPSQIPALIAAGIDSNKAFASLRRCRGLLGPFFGLGPAHI